MARLIFAFAVCGAVFATPAAAQNGNSETPAPQGTPAEAAPTPTAPVLQLPPPGPHDQPAAQAPSAALPDAPVAEAPSAGLPDAPVAEAPPAALPDAPVAEAPSPALPDAPVAEAPSPVLPDAPVAQAPSPALPDAPVAEAPSAALPDAPVAEAPSPVLPDAPVAQAPSPVLPDPPVAQVPSPTPTEKPVAESKAPDNLAVDSPPQNDAAAAESKPVENTEGRYTFSRMDEGYVRLDNRTGQVSFCSKRTVGWTCQLAPEDRGVLENEITRVQEENATLKKELLTRGLPLPGAIKPAPPPAEQSGRTFRLPTDPDLDRMKMLVEQAWRRLVDMLSTLQKEVMKKS